VSVLVLFRRRTERTRNKVGIKRIFDKAMATGEKVTLEQAIEILRAGW